MKKYGLIKNTLIISLGKLATYMTMLLLLPVYTTYINTMDYGYVELLISYASLIIPIIAMELDFAVFRLLIDVRSDPDKAKEVISSLFFMLTKSILIGSVIFMLIIFFLNVTYGYMLLLYIVSVIMVQFFLQITRGIGNTKKYSIASTIIAIALLLLSILFIIYLQMGAQGILLSLIISNVFGFVYLLISNKIYSYINYKYVCTYCTKNALSFSLPLIPNRISWWVINISDRILITLFLGLATNGVYAIAYKFPTMLNALLSIFTMSWTEVVSTYIDTPNSNKYFSEVMNNTIKIFSSIILMMIVILPYMFPLLISQAYREAAIYVPLLLVSTLFSMFVSNYSAIYIALKKTKEVMVTSLAAASINIIINIILIQYIGLYAACISTIASFAIMAIYRAIDVKKYVDIAYDYKTIVLIVFQFAISITLYYASYPIINIVATTVMLLYINKDIIKMVYQNMKERK